MKEDSSPPTKFCVLANAEKIMIAIFWNSDSTILKHAISKGSIVTKDNGHAWRDYVITTHSSENCF
jgi:hypothetical protein